MKLKLNQNKEKIFNKLKKMWERFKKEIRERLNSCKEKISKSIKKPSIKPLPISSLSTEEKNEILNYFKEFMEYCLSKEISNYMYIFSLPYNIKQELKERYPPKKFKRKTLSQLNVNTFGRHQAISAFLREKFEKNFEIKRIKKYGVGEIHNLLHDGYEILATKKALNILKTFIPPDRKKDFKEEMKKITDKLENFKKEVEDTCI